MDEKYPDHRTGDENQDHYPERAVAPAPETADARVVAERAVAGAPVPGDAPADAERAVAGAPLARDAPVDPERAVAAGPVTRDARVAAERLLADAPLTGDARVDAAIDGLSRLAGAPPKEHVAVLEEAHGRLRDILGELAEGQP
jgi:hypothetical protein